MARLIPRFAKILVLLAPVTFTLEADAASRIAPPIHLTCDRQTAPLAVMSSRPEFARKLIAANNRLRGVHQTAWHILVSTSSARLKRDEGDLWDSGRVSSDQTFSIQYGGHASTLIAAY